MDQESVSNMGQGEDARSAGRFKVRVFIAALGFFLLTHAGHFYATDNYTVYLTARALLKGQLAIEPGMTTATGRGGKQYGWYPIGLSLLEAPLIGPALLLDEALPRTFAAAVGPNVSIFYPENFSIFAASLVGPLFGALGVVEFWGIAELLGYPTMVSVWLMVILVASTQFWPATRDSFPHIVVAALLLMLVRRAMTWRGAHAAMTTGCTAGLLILVRPFDAALTLPILTIYLLWKHWKAEAAKSASFSNLVRFFIPIGVASLLVCLDNWLRFDSPFSFHESAGFGNSLSSGLYGLLLSVKRGVIFFSPPVLATIFGLGVGWQRKPAETLLMAALIAIFPLGYARYSDWSGGLCWGPRYIVPAIPLAILPLGELLIRKGSFRTVILVLAIIGFVVQLGATLVDFQRATIGVPAFFTDPAYSQIVAQWQDIIAGKFLDFLPLRLFTMHGITAAIAYVAIPLAMLTWAVVGLRSSFRSMDRSLDTGRLPVRMDSAEREKLRQS